MSIKLTNPSDDAKFLLNESVTFQGTASNDVTSVKLLSEDKWLLGEASVTSTSWLIDYKFNRLGRRQIIAKGLDATGREVARAEVQINIQASAMNCDVRNKLFTIGETAIWQIPGQSAFFYKSGMEIDADGAPNAYHPSDLGIDFLGNAGHSGNWWALVTDNGKSSGNPVIQQSTDPYPGFFISTTSLEDTAKQRIDPLRYVDSTKIPFIVLPGNSLLDGLGFELGDYAAVFNGNNNQFSFAIFADIGPENEIGEGSIALSQNLGHDPFVRGKVRSGIDDNILYVVFPGSRKATNPWSGSESIADISQAAKPHFELWGGMARIQSCFNELK